MTNSYFSKIKKIFIIGLLYSEVHNENTKRNVELNSEYC